MRASVAAALLALAAASGPVQVHAHAGEDHGDAATQPVRAAAAGAAPAGAGEGPQRLADGSLFVPKSVQRRLGIRTVRVRTEKLAAGVELNGSVVADPETSGRVQSPFAGIVHPGPRGMPVAGRTVVKGEVLAYLQPVASAIEQGNQKAQLAEIDGELAIAQRRVQRVEQLEGVVPRKEIEAARIEHAALRQRRDFIAASVDNAVALRAPAGGVVSASHHLVAGQIVDARELLFEIVDARRFAVEALAYDPAIAAAIESARVRVGTAVLDLTFVGSGRQLRGQALPLLFRVDAPDATLAVGQAVKVVVRTASGLEGHAVPLPAMTRAGANETAVWVHTDAERFALRRVRTQPLDGASLAVTDGLHDGDRVVTEGASLLSQVR